MKRKKKSSKADGKILSKREAEVLKLLGEGMTYREVAQQLFISAETVRHHATKIYSRLGVKNKMQAWQKFFGNRQ